VPGIAFVASIPWLPLDVVNRFAYSGVAVAFLAVVIALADRRPVAFATSAFVRAAALTSYSVYMTHTVALDVYRRVAIDSFTSVPVAVHVVVSLVVVGAVGAAFYHAVERPTLRLRRRLAPRRSDVPSPALASAN
jgi:peptidoglycan/LPS O-acetylase OafA/YrhL